MSTANATATGVIPVARTVTVAGPDGPLPIAVRPFRIFGDMQVLNDALPKLSPFLTSIAGGDVLSALVGAEEPCLSLVILATRLDADVIVGLDGDDQLALLVATFEVNADFFGRRLAPALGKVINSLLTPATAPGDKPAFQDMTVSPAKASAPEATPTPGPTPPTN